MICILNGRLQIVLVVLLLNEDVTVRTVLGYVVFLFIILLQIFLQLTFVMMHWINLLKLATPISIVIRVHVILKVVITIVKGILLLEIIPEIILI